MEKMKTECVGESCAIDLTKIGRKEEKKDDEMKSAPNSEGSESSQEVLIDKVNADSSETENLPQRRKTTITWLMPVCITPAAISSKYRNSFAVSEKKTPKSPLAAVAETKSKPKRFFLSVLFSNLWSKCRKKFFCSIPCKKKEKVEKKPRKQCLRFNSGSSSKNHKEKARTEDRKKRMPITCPKLCFKK